MFNFLEKFEENKEEIRNSLSLKHPEWILDLLAIVLNKITDNDDNSPDASGIKGLYRHSLLFVIPCKAYETSTFWYLKFPYEDEINFFKIREENNINPLVPSDNQVEQYLNYIKQLLSNIKEI